MKVCLYFEGEKMIAKSGVGRALKHQMAALSSVGIEYTLDPNEDYDILYTTGPDVVTEIVYAVQQALPFNSTSVHSSFSSLLSRLPDSFRSSFAAQLAVPVLQFVHVVTRPTDQLYFDHLTQGHWRTGK